MGAIIVIAKVVGVVLVVAIIVVAALIAHRRITHVRVQAAGLPVRGDLSAREETAIIKENEAAATLFREMLTDVSLSLDANATLLSDGHRARINTWLHERNRRARP